MSCFRDTHSASNPNDDALALSCAEAVTLKLTTTFKNIERSNAEVTLSRSTVRPYCVPASIRLRLKPNKHLSVSPGACIPNGAHVVEREHEAHSFIENHLVASEHDHHAACDYIQDNYAGDGFTIGTRTIPLPEQCVRYLTAFVAQCKGCRGSGLFSCSQCGGQQIVRCGSCGGHGTYTREERTWVEELSTAGATASSRNGYYQSTSKTVTCGPCGGSGQIDCPGCGGSGAVACHDCRGTGCITACLMVTYDLGVTLEWPSSEIPEQLEQWLQAHDLGELVQDHADVTLVAKDQSPESYSTMYFNITMPFGTMTFSFGDDSEDADFVVSGKDGDIIQGAPFLEATLPSFRQLRGEELAISCEEAVNVFTNAVQNPAVKIISVHALVRAAEDHDDVAEGVRKTLPVGMSHGRTCEIIDAARCYAHLAFDRRRRLIRVSRFTLLSLALFGIYLVLPPRAWLNYHAHTLVTHLVDIGVIAAGLFGAYIVSAKVTRSEVHKTFSPILNFGAKRSSRWNALNKYFAVSGKANMLIGGEVLLLFILTALFAGYLGRGAPMWLAWIIFR